jgi:hypothetical protein
MKKPKLTTLKDVKRVALKRLGRTDQLKGGYEAARRLTDNVGDKKDITSPLLVIAFRTHHDYDFVLQINSEEIWERALFYSLDSADDFAEVYVIDGSKYTVETSPKRMIRTIMKEALTAALLS